MATHIDKIESRPITRRDGATLLSILLFLAIMIPSRYVYAPLGGVGRPDVIMGVGLLFWWLLIHVVPGLAPSGSNPLRNEWRHFGGVFSAQLVMIFTVGFFFDSGGFPQFNVIQLVIIGAVGAMWRIYRHDRENLRLRMADGLEDANLRDTRPGHVWGKS